MRTNLSMNRRCTVLGTDSRGNLVLQTSDFGLGTAPVGRPMLGSSTTGLHACPPIGAQVLVLHDGEHMTPVPASAVTASDTLGTPAALAPGETALFGADGRAVSYVKADGSTVLWSKSGKPSTTIDANGNLSVGGTLTVGGTTNVALATNAKAYGAKGDGTTDDTAALQAALDAAGPKGHCFVPAGTYRISDMIGLPSGVHLEGAGTQKTIIQQNTSNTPAVVTKSWPVAKQTAPPNWSSTLSGYTEVSSLSIKGTSSGTGQHGLVLRDFWCRVYDVECVNCGGHGFYLTPNNSAGTAVGSTMVENRFDRCKAIACGTVSNAGFGFKLGETFDSKTTDGFMRDCLIDTGGGTQPQGHVWIGASAGWEISGIHTYGKVTQYSLRITNGYRTRISDLYVENYWLSALYLEGCQDVIQVRDCYLGRTDNNQSGIGVQIDAQSGFSPLVYLSTIAVGNNQAPNPTNITLVSNASGAATASVLVGGLRCQSGSNTGTVTTYGGTGSASITTLY